jgi:hypothetical protein
MRRLDAKLLHRGCQPRRDQCHICYLWAIREDLPMHMALLQGTQCQLEE